MRILIPLFLLFVMNNVSGQCEYQKNKVDQFEKVKVVITKPEKIFQPFSPKNVALMSLSKINDQYSIHLELYAKETFCLTKDSELLLLTKGGEVTRLKSLETLKCSDPYLRTDLFFNTFIFDISEEVLSSLESKVLEKIRVYTSTDYIELDLTKNNLSKEKGMYYFKFFANCVLKA